MDLLRSVHQGKGKSGVRGGQGGFSWSAPHVANDPQLANYLGHSLKAPKGRWARGKDLEWFNRPPQTDAAAAAGEDGPAGAGDDEAQARELELRAVKQAEEEAMNKALGITTKSGGDNANSTPVVARPGRLHEPAGPAADTPRRRSRSPERRSKPNRGDRDGYNRRTRKDEIDPDGRSRHRHHDRSRDRERVSDRQLSPDRSRERYRHRHRDRSRDRSRERRRRPTEIDDDRGTVHRHTRDLHDGHRHDQTYDKYDRHDRHDTHHEHDARNASQRRNDRDDHQYRR